MWSIFPLIPFSFHTSIFHHPISLLSSLVHISMYISQLFSVHCTVPATFSLSCLLPFLTLDTYKRFT
jgi:hypothetical protein